MNSASNLRRIGAALGLKSVGLKGRSLQKAQRLLRKEKRANVIEHTSGELKPHKPGSSASSEAIRLAQQGDSGAFETIYRQHSCRVYALCLRMLRDPTEAEDLVQDVFVLLFRKIHTFRGESAFSTWLHRLAVNLVLMRLRKKSLPVVSIEAGSQPEHESPPPMSAQPGGAELVLQAGVDPIKFLSLPPQFPRRFPQEFLPSSIPGC